MMEMALKDIAVIRSLAARLRPTPVNMSFLSVLFWIVIVFHSELTSKMDVPLSMRPLSMPDHDINSSTLFIYCDWLKGAGCEFRLLCISEDPTSIDIASATRVHAQTSVWYDQSNELAVTDPEEYESEYTIVSPYSVIEIRIFPQWGFVRTVKVYHPTPSSPRGYNPLLGNRESGKGCGSGDDRCCGGTADSESSNGDVTSSCDDYGCLYAIRACLGRVHVSGPGVYDSLPPNTDNNTDNNSDVLIDNIVYWRLCNGDVIVDGEGNVD